MFPNMISPSPLYHTFFRTAHLAGQSNTSAASASFLVENLLRDRSHALLARSAPGAAGMSSLPGVGQSQDDHLVVPVSVGGGGVNPTPYLKFGVNAILGAGSEQSSKLSKLLM